MNATAQQIRDAFLEEQACGSAIGLPASYEALTCEWLTKAICASVPGARVESLQLGERDDGTANRRRIHLGYNSAGQGAGLPSSVFCKATHDLLHRITLGVAGGVHAEVTFYQTVRPELDLPIPHAIFAAYDPKSFNSLIILNDIGGEAHFFGHAETLSWDQALGQVRLLATLHARFHDSLELAGLHLQSWPQFFRNVATMGQEQSTARGFLAAEGVIPRALFRRAAEIWPATLRSVEIHKDLPQTVIHGDCHLKQWFARADVIGVTDWQCCTLGNWSRDLPYAIATSLSIDDRRRWERELLREYLDAASRLGVHVPAFDEALSLYRLNLLSALNWWTGTLTPAPDMPEMQPPETSIEFIRRIATAIDDLDALDAERQMVGSGP